MRQLIHRFVDWMERGPMALTIFFMPILLVIAAIAAIINSLKGSPLMKRIESFKRRFAFLVKRVKARNARRKKNPDWSRVEEPDNILPSFMYYIVGVPLTGVLMMIAYSIMNGSLAVWIGTYLATLQGNLSFDDRLAGFTAVIILLINLVVIFAYSLNRVPDGDDIVEMISDHDENINERIAELERTMDDRMRVIETDMMPTTSTDALAADTVTAERLENVTA